ncbi:hypothetical protein D2T29_12780 [Sinirhodobacter populi]|uniref:Conjugal transfer protein TraN n=1 Tax=Paenirhodobacter populi TaxID=2306993 RepID=A0A443KCP7_9RHOB|nr:conjugal transfer protein TraN [Sinirhodobacter populi]RWR30540.1 hypothetical protein D2T29_12780 [Sinirhodobacter populi]
MDKRFEKFASLIGIVATAHLSFADLAMAETTAAMQGAATQANTETFKINPSDLYGESDGTVSIVGSTPAGEFPTTDMFYGVTGQTTELPDVDTYEDLYGYRDEQLGNMESGTGQFTSTGAVNAESASLSVLKSSQGTPSISAEAFLQRTRDMMSDTATMREEFGECIVQTTTGSATIDYSNSTVETCDALGISLTSISAQRSFIGPSHVFTFSGGRCHFNGSSIPADSQATCNSLSMLSAIPSSSSGSIWASSCGIGCAVVTVNQAGASAPGNVTFTVDSNVNLSSASATAINIENGGWATHNGSYILWGNGTADVPAVLTTTGQSQTWQVFENPSSYTQREPATGDIFSSTMTDDPDKPPTNKKEYLWQISQNNQGDATGQGIIWDGVYIYTTSYVGAGPVVSGNCSYYRGSLRFGYANMYGVYRTCTVSSNGDAELSIRLQAEVGPFTNWSYNQSSLNTLLEYEAAGLISINYQVATTASNGDGCVATFEGWKCGSDIPADPFSVISDHGATKLSIVPVMSGMDDTEGNEGMTESNTCSALTSNSQCSYIGRVCADPDSTSDASCKIWERQYRCGTSETYQTPIIEQTNICESDLSCMGDDCVYNAATDGTVDLADAASKLAAIDMMLADLDCGLPEGTDTSTLTESDMLQCKLFKGEELKCKKVTLGLANCCNSAEGVSLTDYLQLTFAISRLSNAVEGTALANPVTSSWVGLEDLAGDTMSKLTKPLTEVWDSIVGNTGISGQGAQVFSMEAVKQTMMKSAAEWTANVFGDQAANALFQVTGSNGAGAAVSNGAVNSGTISLAGPAASALSMVMTAYAIYTLINVLASILFACSDNEKELMVKRALRSVHKVGTYCSSRVLGVCIQRKDSYCGFNSPLSRILNEQARNQTGQGWGSAKNPDCSGITLADFQSLDMDQVDLSEWTGMLMSSGLIDTNIDIEAITGSTSTLGTSLTELYGTRENAVERTENKLDGIDYDAVRQDAASDFGASVVTP